jgi:hypothetical protein
MIAVAVVLPSDIDRDMIKLWDATRLNDRYLTCSRTTGSGMLHRRNQNQVPRRRRPKAHRNGISCPRICVAPSNI